MFPPSQKKRFILVLFFPKIKCILLKKIFFPSFFFLKKALDDQQPSTSKAAMELDEPVKERKFEARPIKKVTKLSEILNCVIFSKARGKLPPYPNTWSHAARYWTAKLIISDDEIKIAESRIARYFGLERAMFRGNRKSISIPGPAYPEKRAIVLKEIDALMASYEYLSPGEICPSNIGNTYRLYGSDEDYATYNKNKTLFKAAAAQMKLNKSAKKSKA